MAKRYYDGYYEGMDELKKQEAADGAMISKDTTAQANMPQNVIMRQYPNRGSAMPEDYGDTMKSIDKQIGYDTGKMKSGMKYKK